ncbi:DNA-3-methyladenine glycosidase II [Pseudomonas sp. M47T1]|uniref:DNA-3-methyladenine glycosylase family protein n=1 Tax=unclassified Pseudomonas TaxID=196821 RepID=UPI0002607285|nr:DNA-3-methyladenine glycosylase [Pseudomonas sp. M47T1]EIK96142.1 DNA-3-methyladenine glycosidase II [Pseudomonas sp. M47T1]
MTTDLDLTAHHARLRQHLRELLQADPRLAPVYALAGDFAPRLREPGFAGLARIVCGQQVSVASADAIWGRLALLPQATTAAGFLALGEEGLAGAGLSRSKFKTLTHLAQALENKELDLAHIAQVPAELAIAELTRLPGIGPWTAQIYLMFCAGHPDIFPAGDLALQKAVAHAFELSAVNARDLANLALAWAPYRATAALLFWRLYAVMRGRQGLAL